MICQGWHPDHHHGPRPASSTSVPRSPRVANTPRTRLKSLQAVTVKRPQPRQRAVLRTPCRSRTVTQTLTNPWALKKFSEVAKDGCCPKCGYAVMKRGVNAVTGNLAVGLAAGLAAGGLLGPPGRRSSAAVAEPSTCKADRPHSPVQPTRTAIQADSEAVGSRQSANCLRSRELASVTRPLAYATSVRERRENWVHQRSPTPVERPSTRR